MIRFKEEGVFLVECLGEKSRVEAIWQPCLFVSGCVEVRRWKGEGRKEGVERRGKLIHTLLKGRARGKGV